MIYQYINMLCILIVLCQLTNPIPHPHVFSHPAGYIKQGILQPGQQLPTEADLARQYQVSRITAKRALDELVRQGRGTFVAKPRIRDISGFGSFSADIKARGMQPGSKILKFEESTPEAEVRDRLHLLEQEHVYMLKRLRLANNEPVAVEIAYLPYRRFPDLFSQVQNDLSLYAILAEKYQSVPTWADAEIEARSATEEEAIQLSIDTDMPVLAAQRVTFTANYDIIETVLSVYRGDRFTFYTGRQFIG